jgi:hypothetical protein
MIPAARFGRLDIALSMTLAQKGLWVRLPM